MTGNVPYALMLASLAGLSTGIGSVIAFFIRNPRPSYMSLILGFSGGVMVYISFAELLHTAFEQIGFLHANMGFFAGIAFIMLIDVFIPHEYKFEQAGRPQLSVTRRRMRMRGEASPLEQRLMRAGVLTAIGIAIHNFPEGLVTFSSGLVANRSFGILVASAIAIHNIPEGISVSIPIAQATGSRGRAFLYSFGAGLAEPVGALLGYAILFNFLTPDIIYSLMAFAAGIMVYISLDEILPTAHLFGEEHQVIIGVAVGMIVMALSIYLIL
jgi:ZIP family zinc transporter